MESKFVDDVALYASSHDGLEEMYFSLCLWGKRVQYA